MKTTNWNPSACRRLPCVVPNWNVPCKWKRSSAVTVIKRDMWKLVIFFNCISTSSETRANKTHRKQRPFMSASSSPCTLIGYNLFVERWKSRTFLDSNENRSPFVRESQPQHAWLLDVINSWQQSVGHGKIILLLNAACKWTLFSRPSGSHNRLTQIFYVNFLGCRNRKFFFRISESEIWWFHAAVIRNEYEKDLTEQLAEYFK
jgi:hypothetical protein